MGGGGVGRMQQAVAIDEGVRMPKEISATLRGSRY